MSYLIDGNNLMGRTRSIDMQAPDARLQLLKRLAAFRNLPGQKTRRLTVVFDGAPEPNFPSGSTYQGVHILYAQPGSTADALIKQKVDQQKERRALTVVTSDRAVHGYARSCGIQAMSCEQFNQRLQAALESAGVDEKSNAQLNSDDVDEWMRYFGVESEEEQI